MVALARPRRERVDLEVESWTETYRDAAECLSASVSPHTPLRHRGTYGVEIPITVPTGGGPGYVTAFETAFCISRSGGGYIAVLVGNRNGAAPHCQPGKEQRCNPHQMAQFRFGLCNGRLGHTPSLRAALRRAFFWNIDPLPQKSMSSTMLEAGLDTSQPSGRCCWP